MVLDPTYTYFDLSFKPLILCMIVGGNKPGGFYDSN